MRCRCRKRRSRKQRWARKLWRGVGRGVEVGGYGVYLLFLMQAIRNPTAHEPAVDWPISKVDCLDILRFLSFRFRKLDEATYFAAS